MWQMTNLSPQIILLPKYNGHWKVAAWPWGGIACLSLPPPPRFSSLATSVMWLLLTNGMWTETLCVTSKAKDLNTQVCILSSPRPLSEWGFWGSGWQESRGCRVTVWMEVLKSLHGRSLADKEHPHRSVWGAGNVLLFFSNHWLRHLFSS